MSKREQDRIAELEQELDAIRTVRKRAASIGATARAARLTAARRREIAVQGARTRWDKARRPED